MKLFTRNQNVHGKQVITILGKLDVSSDGYVEHDDAESLLDNITFFESKQDYLNVQRQKAMAEVEEAVAEIKVEKVPADEAVLVFDEDFRDSLIDKFSEEDWKPMARQFLGEGVVSSRMKEATIKKILVNKMSDRDFAVLARMLILDEPKSVGTEDNQEEE